MQAEQLRQFLQEMQVLFGFHQHFQLHGYTDNTSFHYLGFSRYTCRFSYIDRTDIRSSVIHAHDKFHSGTTQRGSVRRMIAERRRTVSFSFHALIFCYQVRYLPYFGHGYVLRFCIGKGLHLSFDCISQKGFYLVLAFLMDKVAGILLREVPSYVFHIIYYIIIISCNRYSKA